LTRPMTTSEVAEALDVSDQTVRTLAREGVLTRSGRHFQYPEVIRQYARHMRGLANARGGASAIESGAAARARVATIRGDRMLWELERERGKWLPEAEFKGKLREYTVWLRNEVMRIPTRLVGVDRTVMLQVDNEIRRILTEIANGNYDPPEITGRRDHG
jgi:excisionase family DNA binding protein